MAACHIINTVSIQSDLSDYYKPLSLAMYQVLEDVGASVKVRDMWEEFGATSEILESIYGKTMSKSIFYLGSSAEGTTNVDMDPDIDKVFVPDDIPVITDCSDASSVNCLLMVQDHTTPAGYAKLQVVRNRIAAVLNDSCIVNITGFRKDSHNRFVLSSSSWYEGIPVSVFERHGPALFLGLGTGISFDHVIAFNCSNWPDCADEWLARNRNNNWPPEDMIEYCKSLGCLFVPVGHPHSNEQHLEWRLSFSHQERKLVTQFNSVQLKCYILLKLWKKEILQHFMKHESLSSYHLKTCMFYMIENTQNDFWRPENLLCCFTACLNLLLLWTSNGNCPNYFIPAENMFDRGIYGDLRQKLQVAIRHLLKADCKYLLQIQTSDIGDRLLGTISNYHHYCQSLSYNSLTNGQLQYRAVYTVFACRSLLIGQCYSRNLEKYLTNLSNILKNLKSTNRVYGHTEEQTQRATSYIAPFIELNFLTNKIALLKQQDGSTDEICQYISSETWHQLCLRVGLIGKLKQASLLYMLGDYNASIDVLSSVVQRERTTVCMCPFKPVIPLNFVDMVENHPNVTTEYLLNNMYEPCVVFMPTEKDVTPDAICYEMLKKVDTPGSSNSFHDDYLEECAMVDSLFLFQFLLYLNHSKFNYLKSHTKADIEKMSCIITARNVDGTPACSHRDACLNILGWVYKDQGHVDRAVECFEQSLEVEPYINAAYWHLRDIQD